MRAGIVFLVAAVVVIGVAPARAQDLGQPFRPPPEEPKPAPKLTKPPQIKKTVEPVYPPEALAQKVSADVTMMVDIDAEGKVSKAEVTKPVGQGFDEAAREAVLQYLFSPAEIDGKPAAIRIEYTLHFVPKTEAPDGGAPSGPPTRGPWTPRRRRPRRRPTSCWWSGACARRGRAIRSPAPRSRSSSAPPEGKDKTGMVVGGTDAEGRFEVKGQPGTAMRLMVTEPRHEPCIRDLAAFELTGDKPFEVDCLVPKGGAPSYETTVRARKPPPAVTRYELAQPELKVVPGTFGDPLRVVQNLPGVARTPFGLGALVIRGASPNDSGIYVEGHKIPLLYHFLVGPGVLAPELIDRIDFFPGNFGVNYGRVTAGIVDVGIKTTPSQRLHGIADISLLHSAAFIEGPLGGKWSGSISARRSYVDLLLPFVLPDSVTTAAPVYWDYQAGVNRDVPGGRLSLYAFGSNDTLKVVSSDARQGNLDLGVEIGFHKVFAVWTQALGNWVNKLSPAYGYERVRFGVGPFAINESRPRARAAQRSVAAGERAPHAAGGLRRRAAHRFDLLQPPAGARHAAVRHHGPADRAAHHSARYAGHRRSTPTRPGTIGGGVTVIPGVRGDYFRYVGQNRSHLRSASRRALEAERDAHLEGGRRHLPPDGRPAAVEPAVRQPEPAADLGGPVFGRVPAPAVAQGDARHHAVLRASPRHADTAAAVQVGRPGALVRPGADHEARVHGALLRLARLHAVAFGADRLRPQRADAGRRRQRPGSDAGEADLVPDRLRPDRTT